MLGEALRLIRVYHDLKQKEAAERLGVSASYLSEIEKGSKTPTLDVIDKYSRTFDIPASSILFFSENLENSGSKGARSFVAAKVLALLNFLEARADHAEAEQA